MNYLIANYMASVLFGVLAVALLFAYAYDLGDERVMRICVAIAALAWVACYIGAASTDGFVQAVATVLTAAAIIAYIVAAAMVLL